MSGRKLVAAIFGGKMFFLYTSLSICLSQAASSCPNLGLDSDFAFVDSDFAFVAFMKTLPS